MRRTRAGIAGLAALLAAVPLPAQTTRPERTGFRETSTNADVLAFLDSLVARGAVIRRWTLAESPGGRAVPVVLAASPLPADPAAAHASGKPIVYLQANIHAGEVEGKEAAQMLLRDLTLGALRPLLDSVILLVVPVYNADGNERFGPGNINRPGQNGPAVVGVNVNGQGLNLNRDYVKLEAPETRGSVALLNEWRPHLFIDLHTTNGSYHGYALTFAPGLNPNSGPANAWIRDRFLPLVRRRMRARHGEETFWYGNFRNQDPDSLVLGWETYDPRPRFGTNWWALRGGMSILSEGYSNAPFRERITATYDFVREVLRLVAERRDTVTALAHRPASPPDSIAVRSVLAPPTIQPVIAEITRPDNDGSTGFSRRIRSGVYRTIPMPVFDRFAPSRREALPLMYLLPPGLAPVGELLARQGVRVDTLAADFSGAMEAFAIDSIVRAAEPFEGHNTVRLEGRWEPAARTAGAGWLVVRTSQQLGAFAGYLLEPASEDGVTTWNLLDSELVPGREYPILRTRATRPAPRLTTAHPE